MNLEENTLYTELKPELETTFASPFDNFENYNPLDTITVNLNSMVSYSDIHNDPEYPNIIGSWDDCNFSEKVAYKRLEEKIENNFGKIISRFKILYHEWEMDGYGYIVEIDNEKKLVTTNHGVPNIVDKEYLNELIKTYKEVVQETERALFLLND